MARKLFGPRLVKALVPSRYKDLTALQVATGKAYSTINDWANGKADPRLDEVVKIAEKVGVDPIDLLRGNTRNRSRVCDRLEWIEAVSEAQEHRPNKLPKYAYDFAGETSGRKLPEKLDWTFVFDLAKFWFDHVSEEELALAETASVQAEMDAEDAAIRAGVSTAKPENDEAKKSKKPKGGK
jgi:hypothetical protein